MELLQLRSLLAVEALAVKKSQVYAREMSDLQLKQVCHEAAAHHQAQLQELLRQLRAHNGKKTNQH